MRSYQYRENQNQKKHQMSHRILKAGLSLAAGMWIGTSAFSAELSSDHVLPKGQLDASFNLRLIDNGEEPSPVTTSEFPWSAVGKIERDDGRFCTGSVVGSNLVLTSAECVTDLGDRYAGEIRFYPNHKHGKYSIYSKVSTVILADGGYDPQIPRTDWAILRLKSRLGWDTGWFGWRNLDRFSDYQFASADYSRFFEDGETAGAFLRCGVDYDSRRTAEMDCGVGEDAMGGPFFANFGGQYQIVATSSAYSRYRNLAIKAQNFTQLLNEVQTDDYDEGEVYAHICNWESGEDIKTALSVQESDGSWTTQGWFILERGECEEVYLRDGRRERVAVYAVGEQLETPWEAATHSFCVSDEPQFRLRDAKDRRCTRDGERRISFSSQIEDAGSDILSIFVF